MNIYPLGLGNFASSLDLLNGLRALHQLCSSMGTHFLITLLITVYALYAAWQVIMKRRYWTLFICVLLSLWILVANHEVPVTFAGPGDGIASIITQAKARVATDQAALETAKKAGVGVASASKTLSAAKAGLAELQRIKTQPVHTPVAFAFVYTLEEGVWFNVLDAVNQTTHADFIVLNHHSQSSLNSNKIIQFLRDMQGLGWFLLPIGFYFVFLFSLLPGQFRRSVGAFVTFATGLFAWTFSDLIVGKFSAYVPTGQMLLLASPLVAIAMAWGISLVFREVVAARTAPDSLSVHIAHDLFEFFVHNNNRFHAWLMGVPLERLPRPRYRLRWSGWMPKNMTWMPKPKKENEDDRDQQ